MLGPDGAVGITALDLYAGTGAVGLDLLEYGATQVDFVEIDSRRTAALTQEITARSLKDKATTYRMDAIRVLSKLGDKSYDLIFADPPYNVDPWEEMITEICRLDLLAPNAWIIAEHSSRKTLPDQISRTKAVSRKRYGDTAITIYTTAT